jgi:hypothetical protein
LPIWRRAISLQTASRHTTRDGSAARSADSGRSSGHRQREDATRLHDDYLAADRPDRHPTRRPGQHRPCKRCQWPRRRNSARADFCHLHFTGERAHCGPVGTEGGSRSHFRDEPRR